MGHYFRELVSKAIGLWDGSCLLSLFLRTTFLAGNFPPKIVIAPPNDLLLTGASGFYGHVFWMSTFCAPESENCLMPV